MNSLQLKDRKSMVFPGTLDPFTAGHLDVAERALKLCDRLYVAVFDNSRKKPAADRFLRASWIRKVFDGCPQVQVIPLDGLLVDFCRQNEVKTIVRGVRSGAQFEEEAAMAEVNRRIGGGVDTLFLPSLPDKRHLSSSLVRELLRLGGDIEGKVPAVIESEVIESYELEATS